AWVSIEDQASGNEETYRLVGSDELDPKLNWISIDSPMARALVGKSIDDEVNVKTPAGDRCFIVTEIRY
nr:GreA/GreB family elongation factor [Pseudomonadales bacterium]